MPQVDCPVLEFIDTKLPLKPPAFLAISLTLSWIIPTSIWRTHLSADEHWFYPMIDPVQEFVDAIGRSFIDGGHLTDETVEYIVSGATVHINRHVREASFQIIR